jgi:hypothetical protein
VIGFGHRRPWRRLTSCVVAYAFALHVALFGLAMPPVALAADQGALGAALCLHDQGAPLAPDGNSDGDGHCKLCTAAGHKLFAAPASALRLVVRPADTVLQPAADRFVPDPSAHARPQPRGPPRTA